MKPKINLIKRKYKISFRGRSYGATEMNIKFFVLFKSKVKKELPDHNDTIDVFWEKSVYNGASVVIRRTVCALVALFLYTLKRLTSSLFAKTRNDFR